MMGTWSHESFGNDTANDWAYELEDATDFSVIEAALQVALDEGDEYLDADLAMEAMKLAGLKAEATSIRGGTDGSRLTFMGLPCPNIFAGEHAFHSKQEWVSVQDMQKATETVLYLVDLFQNREAV